MQYGYALEVLLVARSNKWKDAASKRDGGRFFAIPDSVLNGAAYISLTAHARMLLFDLYAQYKGNNNGEAIATTLEIEETELLRR